MQANQEPNWVDDTTFWEEAWADMSQRLEETPPQRGVILPWWRRYGLLFGLLLLTAVVIVPVAFRGIFVEPEVVPAAPAALPEVDPPTNLSVIAAQTTPPPPTKLAEKERPEASASSTASDAPTVILKNTKDQTSPSLVGRESAPPSAQPVPASILPEVSKVDGGENKTRENNPPSGPERSENADALVLLSPATQVPAALFGLGATALQPLPIPLALDLPVASVPKVRRQSALYLDAGLSAAFQGTPLGNYLGMGVAIPISRKLSLPVGVQLRQDFLQPRSFPVGGNGTDEAMVPVTGVNVMADQDTVLLDFSPADLARVETRGVEVSLGLAYKIAPRLSMQGGLAAKYLFSAASMITRELQAEYLTADQQVQFGDLGLLNSSGFNFQRNNSVTTGQLNNGREQPRFNQWLLRAELGISYRITNRLHLTANGRHLLLQPDVTETIGVRRGQAELGLRWRLK